MLMNKKVLKGLAITGTCLGFIATIITNFANEKEQEVLIEEKIDEALAEREEENTEIES